MRLAKIIFRSREDPPHFVHPPGDGRFGDAEDFGGLGVGQLLAGDQHGGIAKRRLQPRDRAFQPDGVIGVAAVGRRGEADQHRQPVGEGAEASAGGGASRGRR